MVDEAAPRGGIERRQHPRYELLAQVRVKGSRSDYVLELVNISRGGALVSMGSLKLPSWVAMGKSVELAIIHPVSLDAVEVRGTVVRAQSDPARRGFAVCFDELPPESLRGLDELIALAIESASVPPPGEG